MVSRRVIRCVQGLAAAAMLVALYRAADWRAVAGVLGALDPAWLAAALALFVPQTLVSARRWQVLAGRVTAIGFREALRQTLASSAYNLLLPSKLGDLSKAAMVPTRHAAQRATLGGWALAEKLADVATLGVLVALGYLGCPTWPLVAVAPAVAGWCYARGGAGEPSRHAASAVAEAAAWTVTLWLLHLAQLQAFLAAAGVDVSWSEGTWRAGLALFAGLVPVSFCGLGTRDAALVALFASHASAATMAAVGLLTALRYLVPGAVGIPLVVGRRAEPAAAGVDASAAADDWAGAAATVRS